MENQWLQSDADQFVETYRKQHPQTERGREGKASRSEHHPIFRRRTAAQRLPEEDCVSITPFELLYRRQPGNGWQPT